MEHFRLTSQRLQTLDCVPNSSPCFVYTTMPQLPDNFVFLNYPTNKTYLLNPNLKATTTYASSDGKTITFTLTSNAVAPFVFLNLRDHTHGYFSDNGFIMVETKKEMAYYSNDVITVEDFVSQLDITSLFDVTPFAAERDNNGNDEDDEDDEDDDDDNHDDSSSVRNRVSVVTLLLTVYLVYGCRKFT